MAQKYYYDSGEEKLGPVSGRELLELYQQGEIDAQTWVREGESKTWRPLAHVNLKKEEQKQRKRSNSLWGLLFSRMGLSGYIGLALLLLFIVGICFIAFAAIKVLWPVILVFVLFWMISRALRN